VFGSPHTPARAIQQRNLRAAEMLLRELGHPPTLLHVLNRLRQRRPHQLLPRL